MNDAPYSAAEADAAFEAARQKTAQVQAAGETVLDFDANPFRALDRLPDEIAGFTNLTEIYCSIAPVADLAPLAELANLTRLYFSNTRVADLTPLAGLANLTTLYCDNTQVEDLTPLAGLANLTEFSCSVTQVADLVPLAGLANLTEFYCGNTKVADLRPIKNLHKLGDGTSGGFWFNNTIATMRDPRLQRLSEIGDHKERTRETLAYLKSLPPYPEPLPWEVSIPPTAGTPQEPEQNPALELVWADQRIRHSARALASDEVTRDTLTDIRALLDDLKRLSGNSHEDVYRLCEELRDRTAGPDADIHPLRLHLSYQKLRRLFEARATRQRPLDDETATTIDGLLGLLPGVTLSDARVQTLIETQERDRTKPRLSLQGAREARVIAAVQEPDAPFDEEIKDLAKQASVNHTNDRLYGTFSMLARNAAIAVVKVLKWGGSVTIAGVLGNWAWTHLDDIQTLLLTLGDDAYWWGRAVLNKVRAYFEAHARGP